MKELLEIYYKQLAEKSDCQSVIADNFQFLGGDMNTTPPVVGKESYMKVISRFSQLFSRMSVREMLVQQNKACVIANYDFSFPNGQEINGNVAELWTAEDGKLQSLTIYFDTLTFDNKTKRK